MQKSKKSVLICPLDWGLGHATRDVHIIRQLVESGFEVIIGADKAPLYFLRQSFPELSFIEIPSFTVKYAKNKIWMQLKMLVSIPGIIRGIFQEHRQLQLIIKLHQIDIVISDNRYGLWSKRAYSIFITHQLHVIMPSYLRFFETLVKSANYWFIKKYDECWVPDLNDLSNLAGKLAHPANALANVYYIGILSRFIDGYKAIKNLSIGSDFDVLIVLSGPEPQRSVLEKIIISQLEKLPYRCLIIQGKPLVKSMMETPKIKIVNHLNSENIAYLIQNTPVVISRSGYSSVMDYVALGKHALLIPTPGQTEQEYLGDYLMENNWFYTCRQENLELKTGIEKFKNSVFSEFPEFGDSLKERLAKLT